MKIYINSRKIDGYKLRIFADEELVFEDYMFSDPKGFVQLDLDTVSTLKFEYRYLSRKEAKELSDKREKPNGVSELVYDPLDMICHRGCPSPGETLYATVISNIPKGIDSMKLLFRKSALNQDMPVLAVINRELRDKVKVRYVRNDNYKEIIKQSKKKAYGYYIVRNLAWLMILILLLYIIEVYCPKWYYISPVVSLIAYNGYCIRASIKYYVDFYRNVESIEIFCHEKGRVKILN